VAVGELGRLLVAVPDAIPGVVGLDPVDHADEPLHPGVAEERAAVAVERVGIPTGRPGRDRGDRLVGREAGRHRLSRNSATRSPSAT
jgi:hypothetical protein